MSKKSSLESLLSDSKKHIDNAKQELKEAMKLLKKTRVKKNVRKKD